MTATTHAFSVDVEDWYQGIELPLSQWHGKEQRIQIGLEKILAILSDSNITATFFILGAVARSHPKIIKQIAELGHEIASHTMFHEKLYELNPSDFKNQEQECKKILEDASGKQVVGFRAPYFSITKKSLWALDILGELGYFYDSSISPMQTWRYGIKGIEQGIYELSSGLIEFTPSMGSFCSHSYGVGGAYLRIYPLGLTKKALNDSSKKDQSAMFYIHPWELDSEHPRIKLETRPFITHYSRLKSTETKLRLLAKSFTFGSVISVLNTQIAKGPLELLDLKSDV